MSADLDVDVVHRHCTAVTATTRCSPRRTEARPCEKPSHQPPASDAMGASGEPPLTGYLELFLPAFGDATPSRAASERQMEEFPSVRGSLCRHRLFSLELGALPDVGLYPCLHAARAAHRHAPPRPADRADEQIAVVMAYADDHCGGDGGNMHDPPVDCAHQRQRRDARTMHHPRFVVRDAGHRRLIDTPMAGNGLHYGPEVHRCLRGPRKRDAARRFCATPTSPLREQIGPLPGRPIAAAAACSIRPTRRLTRICRRWFRRARTSSRFAPSR